MLPFYLNDNWYCSTSNFLQNAFKEKKNANGIYHYRLLYDRYLSKKWRKVLIQRKLQEAMAALRVPAFSKNHPYLFKTLPCHLEIISKS